MGIFQNSGFNGFACSVRKTLLGYTEHFLSGFAGYGWKIWKGLNGKYKFEIDDIVVRGSMMVFELIISKIRAIKGALNISQGSEKIAELEELSTQYMIIIEADTNSILEDDFIRFQQFSGNGVRKYHVLVRAVDGKKIFIDKSEFIGEGLPQIGDDIIQFGNLTNKARQSCIYLHADENGSPAIDVMFNVDSKDWSNKTKIRLGGEIPGGNGAKGLYCENGMILCKSDKGDVIYRLSPDGAVNIGKGALVYDPVTNTLTMGSNVVITWANLSEETKENIKGESGKWMRSVYKYSDVEPQTPNTSSLIRDGWLDNPTPPTENTGLKCWMSQSLCSYDSVRGEWIPSEWSTPQPYIIDNLDWVKEWDGTRTQINGSTVISPKIFTGTKEEGGALTGVALGSGVVNVNGVERTGVFGIRNGIITFELDSITGNVKASEAFFKDCNAENFNVDKGTFTNIEVEGVIKASEGLIGGFSILDGALKLVQGKDVPYEISLNAKENITGTGGEKFSIPIYVKQKKYIEGRAESVYLAEYNTAFLNDGDLAIKGKLHMYKHSETFGAGGSSNRVQAPTLGRRYVGRCEKVNNSFIVFANTINLNNYNPIPVSPEIYENKIIRIRFPSAESTDRNVQPFVLVTAMARREWFIQSAQLITVTNDYFEVIIINAATGDALAVGDAQNVGFYFQVDIDY